MSVYMIEECSEYSRGQAFQRNYLPTLGYFLSRKEAEDFIANQEQENFELWAKKLRQHRARDEENCYYPELWTAEDSLFYQIFGLPRHLLDTELDTSRQAYKDSYEFITLHVQEIKPHNQE